MQLVTSLKKAVEQEESPFRAQLMREDIARLQRLQNLAEQSSSRDAFVKEGFFVGWTQNDMRTHEFGDELQAFLEALYDHLHEASPSAESESRVTGTWNMLHAKRLERLVGCLSRVPTLEGTRK